MKLCYLILLSFVIHLHKQKKVSPTGGGPLSETCPNAVREHQEKSFPLPRPEIPHLKT